MPQVTIKADFKSVEQALAHLPGAAKKVTQMAINKTVDKTRVFETEAVEKTYNVPRAEIKKTFKRPKKASLSNLQAIQRASGRAIPLYKFGTPDPNVNRGWKRPSYSVDVVKGSRKVVDGKTSKLGTPGFVAATYGSNWMGPKITTVKDFQRYSKLVKKTGIGHPGHLGFFQRVNKPGFGKSHLPIEEIYGMGAPGGMLAKRTQMYAAKKTESFLKAEMNRLMAGVITGKIKLP